MGTQHASTDVRTTRPTGAGSAEDAARALRRRAEALFAPADPSGADGRAGPAVETVPPAPTAPETAALPPPHRLPLREAVLDRLPLWLRLRCGMEPRTVAAVAAVLLAALVLGVHHYLAARPRTVRVPPVTGGIRGAALASAARAPSPAPGGTPRATLVVDVAGKVRQPGLLRLPAGSRVADALAAAGGPLPGADTSALNLARPLADGEQVTVGAPAPQAAGAPAAAGPLSLSTATAEQLDALPGVGPVLARHIVEFRTQHGPFGSVRQLRQITGVGPRRYQELSALVRP